MIKTNVQILAEAKRFLNQSVEEKEKYVTKEGAFTKPKKLSFLMVVLFLIQIPKRSLSVELEDFFDLLVPAEMVCTKSAFSQARYKLDWRFFEDWNQSLLDSFYSENDERVKLWKGYKLQGIDGTTIHLPDHEGLRAEFGDHPNQYGSVPMVRVVGRYDVLNDLLIDGKLDSIRTSENILAMEQLEEVSEDVISIYDRNFAGFEFIYEHQVRNLPFIMRCKLGFNNVVKAFVESVEETAIVEFQATPTAIANLKEKGIILTSKDSVTVRLVKIRLESGELEILITSFLDEAAFPNEVFGYVYNLRWGSETCFDVLKNKWQMAIFSGQKPDAIRQDFHATVFVHNLNAILINDCEEAEIELSGKRTHDYQINKNVSIGIMKSKIIQLFTATETELRHILEQLKTKFIRYMEPVRRGRNYVRSFKVRALRSKFITVPNYARAF